MSDIKEEFMNACEDAKAQLRRDIAAVAKNFMPKGDLHVPEELRDMLGESHIVEDDVDVDDGSCVRKSVTAKFQEGYDADMLERGEMVKGTVEQPIFDSLREMMEAGCSEGTIAESPVRKWNDETKRWEAYTFPIERYEKVDHPSHYGWHPSGVECITIVSEFNYNIGSAITYLWRAGRKPGSSTIEDIEKAIFHLKNEIERLQKDCDYEEAECCQDCGEM